MQGYLVKLGNDRLGSGDVIVGPTTGFNDASVIGTGSWTWTGVGQDGNTNSNVSDTGVYYLGTDGNVYFVPDTFQVEDVISATATTAPNQDFREFGTNSDDTDIEAGADDDEIYGGSSTSATGTGNDTIDAGAGDDTVFGGDGNDTIAGSGGADTIDGGDGSDVIYGDHDVAPTSQAESLNWDAAGNNGADISSGFTQNTGTLDVTVALNNDGGNTEYSVDTRTEYVGSGEPFNTSSGVHILGGPGPNSTTSIVFNAQEGSGMDDAASNVSFRINDIDNAGWTDIVTVNAYDIDGNVVPVTITLGGTDTLSGNTITGANGRNTPDQEAGSALVSIAGPVHQVEVIYANGGTAGQALWITDVHFDTVVDPDGADSITGGTGADLIYGGGDDDNIDGGADNDTIFGGDGDDTLNGGGQSDTIYGGEDNDTIAGDSGADSLFGDAGNDTLRGEDGNDTLFGGTGNDIIFGGENNDTITGEAGDDTLFGGTGDDQFNIADNHDQDTITGGEDTGGSDLDTVSFSNATTSDGVSVTFTGNETGTYDFDGSAGTGSFAEIEQIETTDFDDTIDGSNTTSGIIVDAGAGEDSITGGSGEDSINAGTGADTINAGSGNDSINLGEDAPGTPDGDADIIILEDSFGDDFVSNFDAPVDNGDGTFTGIDTLDVTALTNANGFPVSTNDVTITDDGSGNAVLSFPNGESLTLNDISPADADNPFYLNAIGIPLLDGTVSGTSGNDTINAGYTGDPDGDRVDAGDAIIAGDTDNDDLIEAGGGSDTITAGAGDDLIYADEVSNVGWNYEYYDLDPTGSPFTLEDAGFTNGGPDHSGTPTSTGVTNDFNPTTYDTADDYALKFYGYINVETGGSYTFSSSSDDGSKIFVNGVEVVDNDGHHGVITRDGSITLEPGVHLVEITYYENNGGNALSTTIAGPDTGGSATDLATYENTVPASDANGTGGDDTIDGGAGNDTIFAGEGDDTIVVNDGFGNDVVAGGESTETAGDTLDGSALTGDTTVDFNGAETGQLTTGTDTVDFQEIEVVATGSGDDTINSGTGDDTVETNEGDDIFVVTPGFGDDSFIAGEGGETSGDTLDGSALINDVTVNLTGDEAGTLTDGSDSVTFANVENIITGSGDDTVVGGIGDENVTTGAGADTVSGGAGADTIGTGAGNDSITFGEGDSVSAGTGDDTFTLEDTGEATNNTITIDGGDEDSATGDTLQLGDLADLSTLVTTDDGTGSLSGSVELDDGTLLTFTDIETVICFTPGTLIATPQGARDIADLRVGDMVVTRDHGLQPIRWIQSRNVNAEADFAPIRIKPGVLTGLEQDILVSPQHRMLFQGYRAELLFGETEVLVAAKHLLNGADVTEQSGGTVTYIHMMFDQHEIVFANGAASESFHPGSVGLSGVDDAAREELFTLFPELRANPNGYGQTARRFLKKHETKLLNI